MVQRFEPGSAGRIRVLLRIHGGGETESSSHLPSLPLEPPSLSSPTWQLSTRPAARVALERVNDPQHSIITSAESESFGPQLSITG